MACRFLVRSIDYYGNWKALHYQAKRAFAPLLVNAIQEGDSLSVYLISDLLEKQSQLTLEMKVIDFNGKTLDKEVVRAVEVPANVSSCVFRKPLSEWVTSEHRKNSFLLLALKDKTGKKIAEEVYFFNKTKDLELPQTNVSMKVKQSDGKCEVTLSSSKLAKDVFIQIPVQGARFSDNFFDLLPGKTRR